MKEKEIVLPSKLTVRESESSAQRTKAELSSNLKSPQKSIASLLEEEISKEDEIAEDVQTKDQDEE